MVPSSRASWWALLVALPCCKSGPPTLPPNPPAQAPQELSLDAERIRRGTPLPPVGADTDQPEGRVRGAVLSDRDAVRNCYERVLPASPDAAGRIVFTFTVETSGLVSDATAETQSPALRQTRECILAIIRRTRVDGITRAARVRYPFEFENPLQQLTVATLVLYPRMRASGSGSVATLVGAGSGDFSTDEINAAVSALGPSLLTCYTPVLQAARNPRARPEGTARYELTVAPDGSVVDVSQADITEPVRSAGDCLTQGFRGLRLRSTGRRAVITVPVMMRPQEAITAPR